jgi:hypothetical protein
LRLVKAGTDGDGQGTDVMEIAKSDDLGDIGNLGLSLAEAKLLLASVQQEVVAAQARDHAVRRPSCRSCGDACHVKDYRHHRIATLFGQTTVRLPRFRCTACGELEAGVDWPSHCRSTPELDRLQAHLSALMTYRVAADVLEQMFPIDAGGDHETLRRHTLKLGAQLQHRPGNQAGDASGSDFHQRGLDIHPVLRGWRTASGGQDWQRRNRRWRSPGVRRRCQIGDGSRGADRPDARQRWPNRGHDADRFHRRLSWSAVDPGHRRHHHAAGPRLVPHRDAAAAPGANRRRLVDR